MSSSNGRAAFQRAPQSAYRNHRAPRHHPIQFWISAWLPVLLGIALIVTESTPYLGADHTSGPLRWLWEHLFGPVTDAAWDLSHHLIRKSGHFIGYGLIGLTWLRAWWLTLPRLRFFSDALFALLGTALIAIWDEWHQSFLPNRTSSPWDVLLDCCGATIMLLATYAILRLRRPSVIS